MKLTKPQRAALEILQEYADAYDLPGREAYLDMSFRASSQFLNKAEVIQRVTMRALVRRGLAKRKPGDYLEVYFAITELGRDLLAQGKEADNGTR